MWNEPERLLYRRAAYSDRSGATSGEIYAEVDTKNLASIRSGSSYFKILGLPEEEFPPLARFENAKEFSIAQKDLKDALRKTSYSISTDETRYVLNGILFCSRKINSPRWQPMAGDWR